MSKKFMILYANELQVSLAIQNLAKKVELFLNDGWKLHGEFKIIQDHYDNNKSYIATQSMIKKNKNRSRRY